MRTGAEPRGGGGVTGFPGILHIFCPNHNFLRFCYNTGTIELRIFVGFDSNRSNIVKNLLQ